MVERALWKGVLLTRVVMLDPFLSSVSNPMVLHGLKIHSEQCQALCLCHKNIGDWNTVEYIHSGYADIWHQKRTGPIRKTAAL